MIFSSGENSLSHFVCNALNIKIEDCQSYWSKYSKCVEHALNAARNDAVSALKRSFLKGKPKLSCTNKFEVLTLLFYVLLDYWKAKGESGKETMTLKEILQMRKNSTSIYFDFIEYFVSAVVGKMKYKNHCCEKLLSSFTTVSDEALAILIFENNIATWNNMASKNITKNSGVTRKYTNGGSSQGDIASSQRFQGWSCRGMVRFNKLYNQVELDQKSNHAKLFEENFQEYYKNGEVNGKIKKTDQPLFEFVRIRHSLWNEPVELNMGVLVGSVTVSNEIHPIHCSSNDTHKSDAENEDKEYADSEEDEDPFNTKQHQMINKGIILEEV